MSSLQGLFLCFLHANYAMIGFIEFVELCQGTTYTIIKGLFIITFRCADLTVFSSSIAIVTGPTPPGTGVIIDAFFATD